MKSQEQYLFLPALLQHMECRHLGEAKLESTFLYTLLYSTLTKGVFVADIPARGTQYTTLAMNTFVSNLKYLCTLLYPNSSKRDFCKLYISSVESVCMAAITTPK